MKTGGRIGGTITYGELSVRLNVLSPFANEGISDTTCGEFQHGLILIGYGIVSTKSMEQPASAASEKSL